MPVQYIKPIPKYSEPKQSEGRGIGQVLGGIIGGAAGAIPGIITANPAAAIQGGIAGAGGGASLGGMIGGAVDPDQKAELIEGGQGPQQLKGQAQQSGSMDAMKRVQQSQQTQEQHINALVDAAHALPNAPEDIQDEYTKPIATALQQALKQRNQVPDPGPVPGQGRIV